MLGLRHFMSRQGKVRTIDKYRKIGKVNRLYNGIEPFPTLFWALGIDLTHVLQ